MAWTVRFLISALFPHARTACSARIHLFPDGEGTRKAGRRRSALVDGHAFDLGLWRALVLQPLGELRKLLLATGGLAGDGPCARVHAPAAQVQPPGLGLRVLAEEDALDLAEDLKLRARACGSAGCLACGNCAMRAMAQPEERTLMALVADDMPMHAQTTADTSARNRIKGRPAGRVSWTKGKLARFGLSLLDLSYLYCCSRTSCRRIDVPLAAPRPPSRIPNTAPGAPLTGPTPGPNPHPPGIPHAHPEALDRPFGPAAASIGGPRPAAHALKALGARLPRRRAAALPPPPPRPVVAPSLDPLAHRPDLSPVRALAVVEQLARRLGPALPQREVHQRHVPARRFAKACEGARRREKVCEGVRRSAQAREGADARVRSSRLTSASSACARRRGTCRACGMRGGSRAPSRGARTGGRR